jgi:hypothetical protein
MYCAAPSGRRGDGRAISGACGGAGERGAARRGAADLVDDGADDGLADGLDDGGLVDWLERLHDGLDDGAEVLLHCGDRVQDLHRGTDDRSNDLLADDGLDHLWADD